MNDPWLLLVILILAVCLVMLTVAVVLILRRRSASNSVTAFAELHEQAEHSAATVRADADRYLAEARDRAREIVNEARARADEIIREAEQSRTAADEANRAQRDDLREARLALERREASLEERQTRLDAELAGVETKTIVLDKLRTDLALRAADLSRGEAAQRAELARIGNLTEAEAKGEFLAKVAHESRLQAAGIARELERQAVREAEVKARQIIVDAIQRCASEQTTEHTVTAVALPNEEMKGRIIGREGRNIRSFESVTGVNLMIDDSPETVLLSCFDPVRREAARLTLVDLVRDGRIHPGRIEAAYERSVAELDARILRAAEDALQEVGIADLHPDLLPILGALHYRTSYGQNVLKHLVECAHLASLMAAELGLDITTCKRAAFLHDIGKALTHESEGSHALIGADLARRHGEHPDIVHAIEAHHNEVPPRTVEAILTQACDAISSARPGARRESLEAHVKRLEQIEELAGAHEGVDRVFAMQAGRDIRVMVAPERVNDAEAAALAREIAAEIERDLTYPGQIRVTVVRESRATELAR